MAFYSPFCCYPCDHIFPLTSLSLSPRLHLPPPLFFFLLFLLLLLDPLLRPFFSREFRTVNILMGDLSRFNFNRTPGEAHHVSLILPTRASPARPRSRPRLCTAIRYSRAVRLSVRPTRYSVCILVIFRRHLPRARYRQRLALYLNGSRVIYIIDSRNAPVGIRNDFIFKRGNRLTQF